MSSKKNILKHAIKKTFQPDSLFFLVIENIDFLIANSSIQQLRDKKRFPHFYSHAESRLIYIYNLYA